MLVIIVGDILLPVRGLKTAKNVPKIPNIDIFCHENDIVLDELHILKTTFRNSLETGMGNFPQHFLQDFPQDFPVRFSDKNFPQDFPATISCKIFQQNFPTTNFRNNFPQDFPVRFSCKIFPQDFPTRFSHKNFAQDFPITLFQILNFHQSLLC